MTNRMTDARLGGEAAFPDHEDVLRPHGWLGCGRELVTLERGFGHADEEDR